MEELRCLVCQGQSIADSDAEIAGDMRDLVRRRIAAGERPAAIRAWLVERYGNWVSYRPPREPVGWPLWAAPILLLLGGRAGSPAAGCGGGARNDRAGWSCSLLVAAGVRRAAAARPARGDAAARRPRRCCSAAPAMRCRGGPALPGRRAGSGRATARCCR